MAYCLPQPEANKLKEAFRSGQINPNKLKEMSSQSRRDFLIDFVGETNAKEVNKLFERTLLLKNEERGMVNWAKQVVGMNKQAKSETLQKIKDNYAERRRRTYDPKETEQFLGEIVSDVYSKKFKTEISIEEAEIITMLSQDIMRAEEKLQTALNEKIKYKNPTEQFTFGYDFGAAKRALEKYTGELKQVAKQRHFAKPKNIEAIYNDTGLIINFIADNSRSLKATWDNSFVGRQARKAFRWKTRKAWWNMFKNSWVDIFKIITAREKSVKGFLLNKGSDKTGENIMDAVLTDVYSRENSLNGKYNSKDGKLEIGTGEEEVPTHFPEKIPLLGRLFKASNVAYEAAAIRLRVDIADTMYELAEKKVGRIRETINKVPGLKLLAGKEVVDLSDPFELLSYFLFISL